MRTEIHESDPFSEKPMGLLASTDSDYRFQKGDEIYIDAPRKLKVRVLDVRVHVGEGGKLSRQILALKL